MTNEKFAELFGGERRAPESLITKREMDIAASAQKVTEEVILLLARHAKEITGMNHLVMAGGVALNCVANGKLVQENIFDDIWIQPAAGDAGGALGAALYAEYQLGKEKRVAAGDMQKGSYLGPQYSEEEIRSFLDKEGYKYHAIDKEQNLYLEIAGLLEKGKVIGLSLIHI